MSETPTGVIILYYVVPTDPRIMPYGPFQDDRVAEVFAGNIGGVVAMVTASPVTRGATRKPQNGSDT